MNLKPIPKHMLCHSVTWKRNIFGKDPSDILLLDNVRIHSTNMFFEQSQVQTVWANWILLWDSEYSTPLPDGKTFSIGDTIEWDQYPRVLQITNVKPVYAVDGSKNKIHHFEITLK